MWFWRVMGGLKCPWNYCARVLTEEWFGEDRREVSTVSDASLDTWDGRFPIRLFSI